LLDPVADRPQFHSRRLRPSTVLGDGDRRILEPDRAVDGGEQRRGAVAGVEQPHVGALPRCLFQIAAVRCQGHFISGDQQRTVGPGEPAQVTAVDR
jgi:hypothetical protein